MKNLNLQEVLEGLEDTRRRRSSQRLLPAALAVDGDDNKLQETARNDKCSQETH